jgi:hypothetical protein
MNNLGFQLKGDSNNPFHLSVGVIVRDRTNHVALIKKKNGFFTIPRETIYSLERIEDGLKRCAIEELGIRVYIDNFFRFLGTLITHFKRPDGTDIEKTTVYFFVKKGEDEKRSPETDEMDDEVVWLDLGSAVRKLRGCKNPEYRILERVLSLVE